MAGMVSAAGDALHRLPPSVARPLNLGRPDQVGGFEQAGKQPLEFLAFIEYRTGNRGTDVYFIAVDSDSICLLEALDVDNGARFPVGTPHLDNEIRTSGQHLCPPAVVRVFLENAHRIVNAQRGRIRRTPPWFLIRVRRRRIGSIGAQSTRIRDREASVTRVIIER